ncbi:MAG: prephenate dehydrogenase [Acidaminococcaceae bacterium]|jgi:prephenate dehydrogenase|nr:prephenate dehydrogenase [Acidaminococcaceae bacterium]
MKKIRETVFAIVGLGLIGGSYAKALRNLKAKKIIGVNRNKIVGLMAKDEGYIDELCDYNKPDLREADVIICAIYPNVFYDFVKNNVAAFKQDVLLTDAMGIKGDVPEKIDKVLGPDMDFVAAHPMAGREGKGYGQSAAEIFNASNYIIVKRASNTPEHIAWLTEMAKDMGCKNVVELTIKEHDSIVAYTSDLPHIMAVSLVNSDSLNDNTKYFIAGSFRDATRVADINAALWKELFLLNKENVLEEIRKFQDQLNAWTLALKNNDEEKLVTMMDRAKNQRKELFNAKNYR